MSDNYDFWKLAYDNQWATESDLQEAVQYGDITADEYQQITGTDYPTTTV